MRTRKALAAEQEGAGVIAWRRQQLTAAGFDTSLAAALSADQRSDLHALLELVEQRCPPQLAARILSPLPQPRANR